MITNSIPKQKSKGNIQSRSRANTDPAINRGRIIEEKHSLLTGHARRVLFVVYAAMLRMSETRFISENNTTSIIRKHFNRTNFFKSLVHKLTAIFNTLFKHFCDAIWFSYAHDVRIITRQMTYINRIGAGDLWYKIKNIFMKKPTIFILHFLLGVHINISFFFF